MSPEGDCTIIFRRAGRSFPRKQVLLFAERLREEVAGERSFTCLLTDDRELRRLNRTFREQDYATDVLSFREEESLGEIAISVERAIVQAADQGHSIVEEIQILMLHGLLHLLGMDHESDGGRMARAERGWRKKLQLPVGLIERTKK